MKAKKKRSAWRAIRDSDVVAVVALSVQLYAEDPGTRDIQSKDVRKTLRAFQQHPVRGRCVVAVVDGVVCGYSFLCSFWSNELGGEVCTVDELYVAEEVRGAGIGSGLIKGLVDGSLPWFKKAVALELEVTPSNTRARALYERMRAVNDRRPTADPTHDWPHREERGTTSSFRVARAAEPPVPPLRGRTQIPRCP